MRVLFWTGAVVCVFGLGSDGKDVTRLGFAIGGTGVMICGGLLAAAEVVAKALRERGS